MFSPQDTRGTFFTSGTTQRDVKTQRHLHVKCLIFFPPFQHNPNFSQILTEFPNMKFLANPSCGSESVHAVGQTDRWMEINDETNSCYLQFANAPTNHKVRLKIQPQPVICEWMKWKGRETALDRHSTVSTFVQSESSTQDSATTSLGAP